METKPRPTRVIVCDEQTISRQYFEAMIGTAERYLLIRSADSVRFIDGYCACGYVDLLLMSTVKSNNQDPLELAAFLKRKYPRVKIIMITQTLDASLLKRVRRTGAEALWYKEHQALPLMELMDRVIRGETCYPPAAPVVTLGLSSSGDLTRREQDVLRLLTLGRSDREIADELEIKLSTVRTHVKHLLEKTSYSSRTELAVHAALSHLVEV